MSSICRASATTVDVRQSGSKRRLVVAAAGRCRERTRPASHRAARNVLFQVECQSIGRRAGGGAGPAAAAHNGLSRHCAGLDRVPQRVNGHSAGNGFGPGAGRQRHQPAAIHPRVAGMKSAPPATVLGHSGGRVRSHNPPRTAPRSAPRFAHRLGVRPRPSGARDREEPQLPTRGGWHAACGVRLPVHGIRADEHQQRGGFECGEPLLGVMVSGSVFRESGSDMQRSVSACRGRGQPPSSRGRGLRRQW